MVKEESSDVIMTPPSSALARESTLMVKEESSDVDMTPPIYCVIR